MQGILQRIMGCGGTPFIAKRDEYAEWNCFPLIVSYFCAILDGKDISCLDLEFQ